MIYRKGEFIEVVDINSYFKGMPGKIETVLCLEEERPFVVTFFRDNMKLVDRFNFSQIIYIKDQSLEVIKKNYHFQASMYEMSRSY